MQQFDMRYVGHPAQVGGVTRFIYVGGRADGIRAARVNTGGGLEYTVLESRSMDLYDLSFGGVNCAFIAKPGLVHPAYFSAMEGEFLRFFPAGMLYPCGLLNIGQPRRGAFETRPQHGRIAATPAEEFSAGVDRESGRIVLEGVMRQAAIFHDRLTLRRRMVSEMGGASLHIEDTVTNEGTNRPIYAFVPLQLRLAAPCRGRLSCDRFAERRAFHARRSAAAGGIALRSLRRPGGGSVLPCAPARYARPGARPARSRIAGDRHAAVLADRYASPYDRVEIDAVGGLRAGTGACHAAVRPGRRARGTACAGRAARIPHDARSIPMPFRQSLIGFGGCWFFAARALRWAAFCSTL